MWSAPWSALEHPCSSQNRLGPVRTVLVLLEYKNRFLRPLHVLQRSLWRHREARESLQTYDSLNYIFSPTCQGSSRQVLAQQPPRPCLPTPSRVIAHLSQVKGRDHSSDVVMTGRYMWCDVYPPMFVGRGLATRQHLFQGKIYLRLNLECIAHDNLTVTVLNWKSLFLFLVSSGECLCVAWQLTARLRSSSVVGLHSRTYHPSRADFQYNSTPSRGIL